MRFQRFAGLVLVIGLVGVSALAQDDPAPFPEFSFRRVTVPEAGSTAPRINIQIGDQSSEPEPVRVASPQTPETPPPPAADEVAWFWAEIPAERELSAGRFQAAMHLLETAPEAAALPIHRAEALLAMAEAHDSTILRATIGTRVSPALVLAVMAVESGGDTTAQSSAGAQGLMQLIPATADRFNVTDPFDAAQNIAGGVAYMDWLMETFERDPIMVLAGYNAGEGAVRQANGVPEFAETRTYIPRVLATWRLTRLLCITPPELISDGCVFRTMIAG